MKLSREIAEEQIETLFDYYEIDLEEDLSADGETDASNAGKAVKRKLIKAIMNGRLSITTEDDRITIRQILKRPIGDVTEIVYGSITGQAKTVIKDIDKGSPHAKVYALLGSISGVGPGVIRKLSDLDLSTAECLATVFTLV